VRDERDDRDGRELVIMGITLRSFSSHLARPPVSPDLRFRPTSGLAFHAVCSPIGNIFCLVYLLTAFSCAYLRPHLTPAELSERLQYCQDRFLEELVNITLSKGYEAVNGEGRARQVLELNNSHSATIHLQFFEVQPYGDGLSEVFFLENRGSVNQSKLSSFPRHARRAIRDFLDGLPKDRRSQYKPLLIRQEKLSRRMIFYETDRGKKAFEFTRKVGFLDISNLYGLYPLPDGPFIFFDQEREKLSRKDFLQADDHYQDLVNKFLGEFRGEIKL
jgi:hypothetical protein